MDTAAVDIASQRVQDILDKVKSVFAHHGFEGASMQDLAQAAQMSVGNFYRYFSSKNAIITALVERDLKEIEAVFHAVQTAPDPSATFMQLLRHRIETLPLEDAALWTEMQAASFRAPEISDLKRNMEQTVRSNIVAALARIHGRDDDAAMETYATRAQFMMLLIHGYAQCKYCNRESANQLQTGALAEMVLQSLKDTILTPPNPHTA